MPLHEALYDITDTEKRDLIKLIHIDPPFDVGADFRMDIEIGGQTFHKEPNLLEQIACRDTSGHGADSLIVMIYERLILGRLERQAYLNVAGRLTGKANEQSFARKEHEFIDFEERWTGAYIFENE